MTTACSCGKPRRSPTQAYCRECHAEYQRLNRRKYSDYTDEQKMKAKTRSYTHTLIKRGQIKRKPCKCGSAKAEVHHLAYPNPRAIEWLCRPCHRAEQRITQTSASQG